ncbi:hypothetical protein EIN_005660 [Entamoeba invadens IP1]|uniref:Transmembrane protein n=1 Tax=Entamoeba invadens IP1 TaxID=370355 RepID=A0A0A1UGT4_ENTIV|nr:hypothetical protein EIN_005660 [Entamoeba invadens IP1]ELP93665.1 hypothetical protein EIN_005660 [Entamoeba invadens IP1]|eukprot:XP_004260436.1 hypothetical protein EIN_005660 [Entamoeba invadens IP1]
MTGYYSVAVGMLFVIAGFFGLFASGWRGYTSSLLFAAVITLASIAAVGLNVVGLLLPQYTFLLDEKEDALDLFGFSLEPSNIWFGVGMFYLTIVYIPLVSIAICNACTISKVIERNQRRIKKMEDKKKRKDGFFVYRGNTLKNRIRPEEFGKIREELNKAVHAAQPCSPVKDVKIEVE